MCNAWNHPPGCRCGWGGEGHKGKSTGNPLGIILGGGFPGVPPIDKSFESYTIPNSSCPVCGDLVFFYQSPYGGRVFFDELGPPWPKHPCTDSSSRPSRITDAADRSTPTRSYVWQKEGWSPFFINVVIRVDQNILKVSGELEGEEKVVFTRRHLTHGFGDGDSITPACIAFLRKSDSVGISMSYLSERNNEIAPECYKDSLDARRANPARPPSRPKKKRRKARRR